MASPTDEPTFRQFRMTPSKTFEEHVHGQWVSFDPPTKPIQRAIADGMKETVLSFPRPAELQLVRLKMEALQTLEQAVKKKDAVVTATAWDKLTHQGDLTWEMCGDVRVQWASDGTTTFVNASADPISDVSGCNLQNLDLSGLKRGLMCEFADCVHTCFAGSRLKRSSFVGSRLHGATFTGCKLIESTFAGSNCYSVDFVDADLGYVKWVAEDAGDTAWLRCACFTPTSRNLMGAPDKPQTHAHAEGYADAGKGWRSATLLAIRTNSGTLQRHRDELNFLLTELDRLRRIDVSVDNWQEFYDSWALLDDLYSVFSSSMARAAIEDLFSTDEHRLDCGRAGSGARHALGMAKQLYKLRGATPSGLLIHLKELVGRRLRIPSDGHKDAKLGTKTYFDIVMALREEVNNITSIIEMKEQFVSWINGTLLSVGIGITNYFANILAERYNISVWEG